jgi:hypothetical protein
MNDLVDLRLADLYLAYRKAKADAYYDSGHLDVLAFVRYEDDLHSNLKRLLKRIKAGAAWVSASDIGAYAFVPKSIDINGDGKSDTLFYKCLNPTEEWERRWSESNRAKAKLRQVIRPTVDFQIFSALWIIEAGHKYDEILNPETSYGHRLRRAGVPNEALRGRSLNLECSGLFEPYFSAYKQWRNNGLNAMRQNLQRGERIFGVTMDIQSFYHRASPKFLLREEFISRFNVDLSPLGFKLTHSLVEAIDTWYRATPDAQIRPQGCLPVGLSASKIIANVLLAELDQKMADRLSPFYYGRYVDDIFLVLRGDSSIRSGAEMMKFFARAMPNLLEFEAASELNLNQQLRLKLPYAPSIEVDLVFGGDKQKVFNLFGKHGLDLIRQIEHQIRLHSSEHRLLAILPLESDAMATRTLLAQSDASLEADALRKADVVSVKRLGFALLMRDVESYARDLHPREWLTIRKSFYDLVQRHLLTPIGFFSYSAHLPRVLGLMVCCGDADDAVAFVEEIQRTRELLQRTTTAGTLDAVAFASTILDIKRALAQSLIQATTVTNFRWSAKIIRISRALDDLGDGYSLPKSVEPFKRLSKRVLHADFGKKAYRESWLAGAKRGLPNPQVPAGIEIRRLLRLGAIRSFRKAAKLQMPYWPALTFPTRPINLSEITRAAPELLGHPRELRAALLALRGARARSHDGVSLSASEIGRLRLLQVDGEFKESVRVALPSFLTTMNEWTAAVMGSPSLTRQRYERVRKIINDILRENPVVDYVVFPECSIPPQWASTIARKLAEKRISLIAGLEYRKSSKGIHNEAYISLATKWPWHRTSVIFVQSKFAPAHEERNALGKLKLRLATPTSAAAELTIIQHERFVFAVLICSDMTNIANRYMLQGKIDALIVIEWNRDTETFGALVEATANDLHAYIVQSNNREYGDSRVRVPRKQSFERDLVRVRGGSQDYFVVADLDISALRSFQAETPTTSAGPFKPTPIGFAISEARGGKPRKKQKPS